MKIRTSQMVCDSIEIARNGRFIVRYRDRNIHSDVTDVFISFTELVQFLAERSFSYPVGGKPVVVKLPESTEA